MSDTVSRDDLPWDQLGDHFPQMIDSLFVRFGVLRIGLLKTYE